MKRDNLKIDGLSGRFRFLPGSIFVYTRDKSAQAREAIFKHDESGSDETQDCGYMFVKYEDGFPSVFIDLAFIVSIDYASYMMDGYNRYVVPIHVVSEDYVGPAHLGYSK